MLGPLFAWKAGLISTRSLLKNKKYSHVNGQRSSEIRALLMLRWISVVGAARKAVLLPPACGKEVVCVGPAIYVL